MLKVRITLFLAVSVTLIFLLSAVSCAQELGQEGTGLVISERELNLGFLQKTGAIGQYLLGILFEGKTSDAVFRFHVSNLPTMGIEPIAPVTGLQLNWNKIIGVTSYIDLKGDFHVHWNPDGYNQMAPPSLYLIGGAGQAAFRNYSGALRTGFIESGFPLQSLPGIGSANWSLPLSEFFGIGSSVGLIVPNTDPFFWVDLEGRMRKDKTQTNIGNISWRLSIGDNAQRELRILVGSQFTLTTQNTVSRFTGRLGALNAEGKLLPVLQMDYSLRLGHVRRFHVGLMTAAGNISNKGFDPQLGQAAVSYERRLSDRETINLLFISSLDQLGKINFIQLDLNRIDQNTNIRLQRAEDGQLQITLSQSF
jgi:hypothetical protein